LAKFHQFITTERYSVNPAQTASAQFGGGKNETPVFILYHNFLNFSTIFF